MTRTIGSLDMLNMSAISHIPEDGDVHLLPRSPRIGRLNTYSMVKGYVHSGLFNFNKTSKPVVGLTWIKGNNKFVHQANNVFMGMSCNGMSIY